MKQQVPFTWRHARSLACLAILILAANIISSYVTMPPAVDPVASPALETASSNIDAQSLPYFRDADADGYGTTTDIVFSDTVPTGYSPLPGDCNDNNPAINPGAQEICDHIDNNCDGPFDRDCRTFYRDADNDSYGNSAGAFIYQTVPIPGYVFRVGDCDDTDPQVFPFAPERCNFRDDDCDGIVDEGCNLYYQDFDLDGYGLWHVYVRATSQPFAYSAIGGDCNDGDDGIHPGATEQCNFQDDNCNGTSDEGCAVYYRDSDGDGYGLWDDQLRSTSPPTGYSTVGGDCNDSNPSIHPGATEICNGQNDNCDGLVDEGCFAERIKSSTLETKVQSRPGEFNVTAYPNPASNIFTLQLQGERSKGLITLRILDNVGKVMEIRTELSAGQTIKIGAGYANGIYIAEAVQGNIKRTIKLLKL